MNKEVTRYRKRKNNKKKKSNEEDYLMRSPSINPDDIEINDQISPEERLARKNKNSKEDH